MLNWFVQIFHVFRRAFLIAALLLPMQGHAMPSATSPANWAEQPVRLLMVAQQGCIYCARWDREIGPNYGQTSEGRRAPLLRVDIDGPWPDGLALARRPTMTPTFILVRNGQEISRLEGYPGDRYFYPLINDMLNKLTQIE